MSHKEKRWLDGCRGEETRLPDTSPLRRAVHESEGTPARGHQPPNASEWAGHTLKNKGSAKEAFGKTGTIKPSEASVLRG